MRTEVRNILEQVEAGMQPYTADRDSRSRRRA